MTKSPKFMLNSVRCGRSYNFYNRWKRSNFIRFSKDPERLLWKGRPSRHRNFRRWCHRWVSRHCLKSSLKQSIVFLLIQSIVPLWLERSVNEQVEIVAMHCFKNRAISNLKTAMPCCDDCTMHRWSANHSNNVLTIQCPWKACRSWERCSLTSAVVKRSHYAANAIFVKILHEEDVHSTKRAVGRYRIYECKLKI